MAIYHCHVDCYRRSDGKSAVGGFSYRRGIKNKCAVTSKNFDFRRKSEAIYSEFINADCDNRIHDLESIKNIFEEVEKSEKHPRGTLGREIECGLPNELTTEQQIILSKSFISELKKQARAENAFFDFSIHAKDGNNHVHIAMSERVLEKNGECFKLSKTKRRDWHEKDFVSMARKLWEIETNLALEEAGINQRVDCRTLAQQSIIKIPTIHEGKSRHIKNGERKMINEEIKNKNALLTAPTNDSEIIDISSFYTENIIFGEIENADEDKSKLYQYRLAEEKYKGFHIFGLTYINMKNPAYVTMNFSDKSTIVDNGSLLTAKNGTAKDNAERIINLAQLKGWKSVKLSGSDDFVKEAMLQAHIAGLEVKVEDIVPTRQQPPQKPSIPIKTALNVSIVPTRQQPPKRPSIPLKTALNVSQWVNDGLTHAERHARRFAEKQVLKNNSITVNSNVKNETQALTTDIKKRMKL